MKPTQEWPVKGATSQSLDRTADDRIGLGDWVLVRAKCAAIIEGGTIAVQSQSTTTPDTAWHYVPADHVLTIAEARKSFGAKTE